MQPLHILHLKNEFIFSQLQLEEALLRADDRNWCLINQGSAPAIVMGISSKPEELLNLPLIQTHPIPVIRRFSGGGTVVVDNNTFFVTFIINRSGVSPEAIMQWSQTIYSLVFPDFTLRENDYVFHDRKFAGNAQYLRKDRFLHHTSFLWDFDPKNMLYLTNPKKAPAYRNQRTHTDFLCTLHHLFESPDHLQDQIIQALSTQFHLHHTTQEAALPALFLPHRKATIFEVTWV